MVAMPDSRPRPPVSRIFVGADGLRAGWSLAFFVALLAIYTPLLGMAAGFLLPARPHAHAGQTAGGLALREAVWSLAILAATWTMAKTEGRPMGPFGFGRPGARRVLVGALWGFAALSLLVLVLRAAGLLAFAGFALGPAAAVGYAAAFAAGFLLVAFSEEYLMRGYAQFTLARGLAGLFAACGFRTRARAAGFWASALILSSLFGLGHRSNPGESPVGLVMAGAAGLVFCYSLWRSGSLWWALGFHAAWDWAETYFYGTADSGMVAQGHLLASHPTGPPLWSGGATGPEGSLLVLPLLVAVAVVIRMTLKPRPEAAA